MSYVLEVRSLVTRFYTEDGIVNAVNGISYALGEGESMAIVGESGCGKTVSVLSIMGLIPSPPGKIESGQVLFHGHNLLDFSAEEIRQIRGRDIAMIFQDPMTCLNPVLTIGRQLTEAMRLHLNLSRAEANERACELLQTVGIPDPNEVLGRYPHQFSGGQRQRVMIAMALSCNPSLLIADEPTTALDVTIQAQIVELVKQLQDRLNMAVIWITHDLAVVAGLVEKVSVMYAGFIVESGPVATIYKHPSHPYTRALLDSLPKVDADLDKRLKSIAGLPPDLLQEFTACPFAPRCSQATAQCHKRRPELVAVGPNHLCACWYFHQHHSEAAIDMELFKPGRKRSAPRAYAETA